MTHLIHAVYVHYMIVPDRTAKSYIVNSHQWWRNGERVWVAANGLYVFHMDGSWWLMGDGEERFLTSFGIKCALRIASTEFADILRSTAR